MFYVLFVYSSGLASDGLLVLPSRYSGIFKNKISGSFVIGLTTLLNNI